MKGAIEVERARINGCRLVRGDGVSVYARVSFMFGLISCSVGQTLSTRFNIYD
jgi:hypothetical protein